MTKNPHTKNNYLYLEGPVSRHRSIRIKLSNLSWDWGVANFFIQQVPFSFTTGKLLASAIAKIMQIYTRHTDNPLTKAAELGAGTGLLSKHILDYLYNHDTTLFDQLTIHISDYSKQVVQDIQESRLFEQLTEHIHLEPMNALSPKFDKPANPQVIVASYLLDSLPHHHLIFKQGKLYETQLTSHIPNDATLIDSTCYPPQILNAPKIKDLFTKKLSKQHRILSQKLIDLLVETSSEIPIEDTSLTKKEIKILYDFCDTLPKNKTISFNYGPFYQKWLTTLYKTLPEQGMIIITDFGQTQPVGYEQKELMSVFNVTCFYSIYFPLLIHFATKSGFQCCASQNHDGHSQILILHKGFKKPLIEKALLPITETTNYNQINNVLENIHAYPNNKQLPTKIAQDFFTLSPEERSDHFLLSQLALIMGKHNYLNEAKAYAQQSLLFCPNLAIGTYSLLGYLEKQDKNLEKAGYYFKKCLDCCSEYPDALINLSFIAAREENYTDFVTLMTRYLPYAKNDIWEHLISLSLVLLQLKKTKKATPLIHFIAHAQTNYPSLIPEKSGQKIKALQSFLKQT